ncbi:nucleotidyltransferase family protein [Vibrio rumoiensis]|uniref:Nitrate reductase n=1 Tax=Vibrio rumoiensis 1S-45 TaxID=1188252 RepID=A0A1E5DZC9_9VIBR|nr:nucleotidyltransferase family protein [Vibrio rumoiensis]OEF23216.1 nitrate reductase [Vibrio rumoiensis 1S-45]
MERVISLIKQDPLRVKALNCVYSLHLPQCYIAAGFVRNLVWDHTHQKNSPTPLNDVDVIYFDSEKTDPELSLKLEAKLHTRMPEVNWQVRNQALMHIRNDDQPYLNTLDAMRYWPEKETAVAIRQIANNQYECLSAFGFECLFANTITHNPKRQRATFEQRIASKNWLVTWPLLTIKNHSV